MAERPEPAAPRRARRLRPRIWVILVAVLLPVLLLAAAGLGWLLMGYPDRRGVGRGRVVEIELARGAHVDAVAHQLARAGALAEPELFAIYARLRGAGPRLRSGRLLLYDNMSPKELLQRVAHGYGSAQLRVVIPEGYTRFEIAARLARWGVCDQESFLRATTDPVLLRELAIDGTSAEGLLFPDTYLLREDMDPSELVRRLVRNARRRLAPLLAQHGAELERLRSELGFGAHELFTLASIVEEEAQLASEQPIIAGVFINRLRDPAFKPKRLQADPTVLYGCQLSPELASCSGAAGKTITRAMLLDAENAYNTYRHDGLPPGPIANPGLAAVRAVLAPAQHEYLYFVAQGGGAHAFSRSLDDHHSASAARAAAPPPPALGQDPASPAQTLQP